jgi:hypothetical protein
MEIMKIPYKQMFSWKAGNLGITLLGIWYVLLPWLAGQGINNPSFQGWTLFGLTFISISLVRSGTRPTVIGSLATMLIGLSYFFGFMHTFNPAILWSFSLLMFVAVLAWELGFVHIGPSNVKTEVLLIVPLACLGFAYAMALFGFNPMLSFTWTSDSWFVGLNYLAVMLFCWIYVFNVAGWKPLGKRTIMWLGALAIIAIVLSFFGLSQTLHLFAWTP